MRSGVPQLAIALPLPHRRPSLLSLNSVAAASPHTPRSSGYFDACPPPVYYANINKRNSTDSWTSSNAAEDMMDLDWKPEQLLLLTRTLDALPAHLVTPFNGPVPPSNLLDKIARGVAHAKGPLDWPHSIRATRAKLLDLARTRAKEDALAEKRRHIVIREEDDAVQIVQDDDDDGHDLHDGADKPLRGVGIGPRRPLYRQSSMDFIKPGAGDLKDNQNIARLSNRLQRTDRTFPNPAFHPYARSARSKPQTQSQRQDENRRSSSPPHSSDVPSLMMMSPSTPSSTTLNSDTHSLSLSSYALRPRNVLRRSASTMSSSSLFTTSSTGSGGGGGNGTGDRAMDRRLQRVRRSDSFSYASSAGPPPTPAKDYAYTVQTSGSLVGIKRAPSYGALRQGKKGATPTKEKQAPVLPQTPPRKTKELAKETPTQVQTQHTQTPKHTRQISAGSCASSDEEEKVRTRKAKKMRSSGGAKTVNTHNTTNAAAHSASNANTDTIMHSPGPSVPPSPSVGAPSAPGSPMGMGTTTLMGGPIPGGILSWGRAGRMGVDGQMQLPMESPKRRAKPYLYERERGMKESGREKVVEGGREREREKVAEGGKERKEREAGTPKERVRREKERMNKEERHSSSAPVASTTTMVSTSAISTAVAPVTATGSTTTTASANAPATTTTVPTATPAAATTTIPAKVRAPRMSAQRNPSMFGAELPVLKPSTTTGSVGGLALGPALPAIPSSASRETTGREPLRERSVLAARSPRQMHTQTQTQVLMARAPVLMQSLVSHSNAQSSSNAHSSVNARSPTASAPTATTTATASRHRKTASSSTIPPDPMDVDPTMSPGANADKERRVKTLRRVRRLPGARRISFGMGEGEEVGAGAGGGLGAALSTGVESVGGGLAGLGEGFAGSPGGAGKRGLGSAFQMS